eukprot:CAMPEP_0119020294 /NCGR_PEP_ID=MMETSP1176-20130426/23753_1 /TAXON_ID=265551 /ORGANISM="Synedropsis recta cf, Strain CCMP1620" /LENGTH=69 /DNA_ID=CAMNT_0006974695 /DNA_START=105 /DNA_END=310 /DNA_ORIENTATION=-
MNPLLSDERRLALEKSFGPSSETKSLTECYMLLFTDAEREHLDEEHFLQDWEAYCQEHPAAGNVDAMSL